MPQSQRSLWAALFVLGTAAAACAPESAHGEAAFRIKLNECERSLDACKTECAPPTSDARSCDALLVVQVEDFVYTHKTPLPDAEDAVERNLHRICESGIGRACGAERLLAAQTKNDATLRESDNVEVRAGELERQALAIAASSTFGFTSCADTSHAQTPIVHAACNARDLAVTARRCMSGCDTCSPGCKVELANAETAFAAAQKLSTDQAGAAQVTKAATDEATVKERSVANALTEVLQHQEDACFADLPACKRSCAASAMSMSCGFLATAYASGKAGVAVDVKEATRLARGGCTGHSPNKLACAAQKQLEAEARSCADQTCKTYCDAAKCGYPPGSACAYGDSCARAADALIAESKDNADQAAQLFDKGCAANSAIACEALGTFYGAGTGVAKDVKKGETLLKKACDLHTAEMRTDTARVVDPVAFGAMQNACKNYEAVVCVNKVQSAARRRPAKDAACGAAGATFVAWATLTGTDADGCASALTAHGCQEVEGQGVYCCPQ